MAMHLLKIGVGVLDVLVCVGCQVTYEVLGELTVSGERGSGNRSDTSIFVWGYESAGSRRPPGTRAVMPGRATAVGAGVQGHARRDAREAVSGRSYVV